MQQNKPFSPEFRPRDPSTRSIVRGLLALAIAFFSISYILMRQGEGDPWRHFIFSYLVSFSFYLTISLGALFFVMLQHLTGARWSMAPRRLAEGLMMNLPLLLLLFMPILCSLSTLYAWDGAKSAAAAPILDAQRHYLNPIFFRVRSMIYFAVWIGLAGLLDRRSPRQDRDPSAAPALVESLRRWSAPGMLLFAFTVTFASFDWLMSLDSRWSSTIFGVYVFSGAVLAILATLILVSLLIDLSGAMDCALSIEHFHDLGKLLFGFVIFWAYIAFSQFMLIWMGNLPEETIWYLHRWQAPGWRAVSLWLIVGQFILPLLFLLSRAAKRNRLTLGLAALWVLLMHYLDLYWLIMPNVDLKQVPLQPADILLLLSMGCLFFSIYLGRLGGMMSEKSAECGVQGK